MNTKITLTNPTDDELNAAVAEHVCGWRIYGHVKLYFSTSADAVLPLLEKWGEWTVRFNGHLYRLSDAAYEYERSQNEASAPTFPRAACIALLRANGVEVVT